MTFKEVYAARKADRKTITTLPIPLGSIMGLAKHLTVLN